MAGAVAVALPVPIFVAPKLSPLQRNWYCSLNSIRLHCKYSKSEQENSRERSVMKFAPGDLVRNITANLDGRVIEAYKENGEAMYMVSVLIAPASWRSGPRVQYWSEHLLDFSPNSSLDDGLCVDSLS